MQSTLPLFDVTLTISDAEFANIAGLSIAGGVGLASLGTGGAWLWYAGASAGPMGLLFAGGVTAVAAGAVAICESVKWGEKQKTNREHIFGLVCLVPPTDKSQLRVSSLVSRRQSRSAVAFSLACLLCLQRKARNKIRRISRDCSKSLWISLIIRI
jgi:hypothetical protein